MIWQACKKIFFSLVTKITRIPGVRKLAWTIYKRITPDPERWIKVHGVFLLTNIHDNGIGTRLFFKGEYIPNRVSEVRQAVKPGDVAIDIGANIGFFTTLLATLVGSQGKVYAFEPDPRNFQLLQRTIEKNAWSNVFAFQKAVSDKDGKAVLYQTKSSASNTLIPGEHVSEVEVDVVALDSFLSDEPRVDFVKMDTDGSEPLAIQGMGKIIQRSPGLKIVAEYTPGNVKQYLKEPLEFISIADKNHLKLTAILDEKTGRMPNLDLTPLNNLHDEDYLDLIFTSRGDQNS